MKTLAFLGGVDEWMGSELYAKLKRIESRVHRIMTNDCNTGEDTDVSKDLARVQKLLPNATGIFINGDPRGYSLKIKSEDVRLLNEKYGLNIYRDWGDYGIIAPEF
jgi:hypothetical protein